MNWSLFFSTFMLIFQAELGDKNQLAVMGQSAANSHRWTIFCAATLALATSTAIGVLAGDMIRRFVPDERWIKWAGGFLFLIFGALMIRDACLAKHPQTPVAVKPSAENTPSWLNHGVIHQLGIIEMASVRDYEGLIKANKDPEISKVLYQILEEEKWHHSSMLCALSGGADRDIQFTMAMAERLPPIESFVSDLEYSRPDILNRLIEREKMIARLYLSLSEKISDIRLRDTFEALSATEENHAKRLEKLLR